MNGRVAPSLAEAWIGAWNRHDLETILHQYAPDVECISPFVPALSGDPSGTLHGRERLTAYFRKGLQSYPDLHFDLLHVLTGINSLMLYYRSVNGLLAAEMMTVNAEGLINTVRVHYVKE